jgi:hypothetical protein
MSTLSCPHCDGTDWLPVVKVFLDVGLSRPPRALPLERDDDIAPYEVCFRCVNGCVGLTATGQFVPMWGRAAPKPAE